MARNRRGKCGLLLASSSSVLLGALSGQAAAQPASSQGGEASPPAAASSASTAPGVQEIVVTAQKREQSINTVGEAITAETGAQLKAQGVTDVAGLTRVDPSFVLAQSQWGSPIYQIRGVSYNNFSLAAAPAVSVYTDEIPYPYPETTKGAPFDLDRVEILKGPQGTLYGQNATGGAVNYIAAKPTNTLAAEIEGTYASYNAFNLNGYVSGPVTDTIKARLSFNIDQGGAWQQNYLTGAHLGDLDNKFVRLVVVWTPIDRLKVTFNLNGWTDNSDTQAAQFEGAFPSKPTLVSHTPVLISSPQAPDNDRAAGWVPGTRPQNDESYYQGSARVEYRFTDDLLLTYLGSYSKYTQNDLDEPGGSNYELELNQVGSIDSTSQEVRVSGKALSNKINWLLGGDYSRAYTTENQNEDLAGDTLAFNYLGFEKLLNEPQMAANYVFNDSTDQSESKAVFGNVEYRPVSPLNLHAGIRYTDTDIDHGGCSRFDAAGAEGFTALETYLQSHAYGSTAGVVPVVPGGCGTFGPHLTPYYFQQKLDQDNVSWRVGADWTPLQHTLAYASVSKGYKAGNFPTLAAASYLAERPVTQESVLAYELGVKTLFLQGRLRVNADVFYYDYDNKQLEMREPDPQGVFGLLNTLVNIPKSQETGAEVTSTLVPIRNLTLTFTATWLDSEVTSNYLGYNPFSTTPIDLKGEPFPSTPKWSLNGDAQYNFDIGDRFSAFVGLDAPYQTKSQGEFGSYEALAAGYVSPAPPAQPGSLSTVDDAYAILDLRAGVTTTDGHWRLQVFGKNVTNTYYWTNSRLTGDSVVRFAGMPDTFGIRLAYKY